LTNNHQDSAYLTPAQDKSSEEIYPKDNIPEASTVSPNPIIEKYLEKRLEEEAAKQKDVQQKQEAQQLIQILRKAYLKQLVESLKEEETVATTPSASAEGVRGSRSIESKEDNAGQMDSNVIQMLLEKMRRMDMDASESQIEEATSTPESAGQIVLPSAASSTELPIILNTEIFSTSTESSSTIAKDELADSENIIISSTERHNQITSSEFPSSTEQIGSSTSTTTANPQEDLSIQDLPAMWVKTENIFSGEGEPISIRVRRQTGAEEESAQGSPASARNQAQEAQATPSPEVQSQIQSFVEDIKKFFTLLNVLDQDQCLQKLVCDVHTNQKDPNTLTQYEQNILTTFR
jgi:hypothetical protein